MPNVLDEMRKQPKEEQTANTNLRADVERLLLLVEQLAAALAPHQCDKCGAAYESATGGCPACAASRDALDYADRRILGAILRGIWTRGRSTSRAIP